MSIEGIRIRLSENVGWGREPSYEELKAAEQQAAFELRIKIELALEEEQQQESIFYPAKRKEEPSIFFEKESK